MSRSAVVLFNLGGPDGKTAIRPFLYNLFSDPAILGLPAPFRQMLAYLLSRRREKAALEIYAKLGDKSPLLENTQAQAEALTERLQPHLKAGDEARVFIAMRYWLPMSDQTVQDVLDFAPDRVVLLPLYPQYSSATTGSSLTAWRQAARIAGLAAPETAICCYPAHSGFVTAMARLAGAALKRAGEALPGKPLRLLFSAHGLPKRMIEAGDPYQAQCEITAAAVAACLKTMGWPELDSQLCYQSRVGPLEWIGPGIDAEITRAGEDGVGLVVVPLAFVSEHSETLVELGMLYREKAAAAGVPFYELAPAVGTHPAFIKGLGELVLQALTTSSAIIGPAAEGCSVRCPGCPQKTQGKSV